METQTWSTDRPVPYARNPRNNKEAVAKVAASIKEFGWQQPIVVDGEDVVIVGHTRLLAAQKLGLKEVPVVVADKLTPEQVKAYRIADNKTAEYSDFDNELLILELEELQKKNYDLLKTAFQPKELENLLFKPDDGLGDEEAIPFVDSSNIVLGDIYQLGNHRLMCGDATSQDDVNRLMDGNLADMIWIDPPYNVNYTGGGAVIQKDTRAAIENDNMDEEAFYHFLHDSYTTLLNITKPGAPIYVAHSSTEAANFILALKNSGWYFKQTLIWVKSSPVLSRQDHNWMHEPILYGWKPGAAHKWYGDFNKPTVIDDAPDITKMNKQELLDYTTTILESTDITRVDKQTRSPEHPTMKPVELIEKQLNNSSQVGDIVVDTFGGSGSTLIACEKHGRECRMLELTPIYTETIIKRWEDYTGQKAVKLN